MLSRSLLLAVALFSGVGCTSTQVMQQASPQMGNLIVPEPVPVSVRSQMALARLEQILGQMQDMPNGQRAELLYQRGVLYDSVGLSGLAQFDFNRALKLKPDMAKAYNFLGIQHTQNMEFMQAYEAFDATLDIEPEHEYAFLNRGIALYYGGRPQLAVRDFGQFYQQDNTDPYRALWHYIAEYEVSPEAAQQNLRQIRSQLSNKNWATALVDFYLGNLTEQQVLGSLTVNVKNHQQLSDRLCEAYFYLGKYHSHHGKKGRASNYFKLALSTNVYEFVEHRYARLELNLLRENAFKQSQTR